MIIYNNINIILIIILIIISHINASYHWYITIYDANYNINNNNNNIRCHDCITELAISTSYKLSFQISDENGDISNDISAALYWNGLVPSQVDSYGLTFDIKWNDIIFINNRWWVEMTTPETPRLYEFIITTSSKINNAPKSIITTSIDDTALNLYVSLIIKYNNMMNRYDSTLGEQRILVKKGELLQYDDIQSISNINNIQFSRVRNSATLTVTWDSKEMRFLVTNDDLLTQHIVTLELNAYQSYTLVCDHSKSGVNQVLVLPTRSLIVHGVGLLQYTNEWSRILNVCIDFIISDIKYRVLAISKTSIYLSNANEYGFNLLLDNESNDLYNKFSSIHQWNNNARIISIYSSPIDDSSCIFILLYSGSKYHLYHYDNNQWLHVFEFPSSIKSCNSNTLPYERQIFVEDNNNNNNISNKKLLLNEMTVSDSGEIFVWGNSVAVSFDQGYSFHCIETFDNNNNNNNNNNEIVKAFSIETDGIYTFYTNSSNLYVGHISLPLNINMKLPINSIQVPTNISNSSNILDYLITSTTDGTLHLLTLHNSSHNIFLAQTYDLRNIIQKEIEFESTRNNQLCPYSSLSIIASNDGYYTRSRDLQVGLPENIYLEWKESYTFSIIITSSHGILASDLQVGHILAGSKTITLIKSTPIISADQKRIQYNYIINDNGYERNAAAPSENIYKSQIRIMVLNSSLACSEEYNSVASNSPILLPSPTNTRKLAIASKLSILSGCPPRRSFRLSVSESRNEFENCIDSSSQIACFSYNYQMVPKMYIYDEVTGQTKTYEDSFVFEIVGGGQTLKSIRNYTSNEIDQFNQGNQAVWTSLDGSSSTNTLPYGATIDWVCAIGSPCSGVVPEFPNTPDYYFLVRISTQPKKQTSYCSYETYIIIRLYGIPLDFIGLVATLGVTVAVLFVFVIIYFIGKYEQYSEYKEEIDMNVADAISEASSVTEETSKSYISFGSSRNMSSAN